MPTKKLFPWQERLIKTWNEIKELIAHIANIQNKLEKEKAFRSTWIVLPDTRRNSQVINNKPRHLVKKIIR